MQSYELTHAPLTRARHRLLAEVSGGNVAILTDTEQSETFLIALSDREIFVEYAKPIERFCFYYAFTDENGELAGDYGNTSIHLYKMFIPEFIVARKIRAALEVLS